MGGAKNSAGAEKGLGPFLAASIIIMCCARQVFLEGFKKGCQRTCACDWCGKAKAV